MMLNKIVPEVSSYKNNITFIAVLGKKLTLLLK